MLTYTCTRCGDSYTESIDALGHDWVNSSYDAPVSDDEVDYYVVLECTRCGLCYEEEIVVKTETAGIEAHTDFNLFDVVSEDQLANIFDSIEAEDGWELDLELTITALEEDPEEAAVVEEKVEEILDNATVYYLSIDIGVIVIDENGAELFTDTITESNAMIEFTVTIPEELLEAEGDTYTVIRVHGDEITELSTTANEDGTLTFASDMFSTYAIVKGYAIEEEPDEGGQPGGRNRHHAQAHRAEVNKHEVIGL